MTAEHKAVRINIYRDRSHYFTFLSIPHKRISCTVKQFQKAYPKMKGKVWFKVDSVQARTYWCTPLNEDGVKNLYEYGSIYGDRKKRGE